MECAINKAGRQRMLGQRIVKSHIQIAADIWANEARAQLAEALWSFDAQLHDLIELEADAAVGDSLAELAAEWLPFRQLAVAPPSREGAAALRAAGECLLDAAERHTSALERLARTAACRLVNLSGRQRMLTQRIAKNFILRASGEDNAPVRAELDLALVQFEHALSALRASQQNTAAIYSELVAISAQWEGLKSMLEREDCSPESAHAVIAVADAMLRRTENTTSLYERLAGEPGAHS